MRLGQRSFDYFGVSHVTLRREMLPSPVPSGGARLMASPVSTSPNVAFNNRPMHHYSPQATSPVPQQSNHYGQQRGNTDSDCVAFC